MIPTFPAPRDPGQKKKRWHALLQRIDPAADLVGAEIGVWRAILSRELLAARPRLFLHLVDPYRTGQPGTEWWQSGSVMPARPQADYDAAFSRAVAVTLHAKDRRQFHRAPSVEAAEKFDDASLDFVFVDGDHSYGGCLADIRAWLPKIKVGGWIGGHDYDKPDRGQVSEAVYDAFQARDLELDAESTWFVPVTAELLARKRRDGFLLAQPS